MAETGVGTVTGDMQRVYGTARLSLAITTGSLLVLGPKDGGLVAVKRQRHTVALQISLGGFKIGESGLQN